MGMGSRGAWEIEEVVVAVFFGLLEVVGVFWHIGHCGLLHQQAFFEIKINSQVKESYDIYLKINQTQVHYN